MLELGTSAETSKIWYCARALVQHEGDVLNRVQYPVVARGTYNIFCPKGQVRVFCKILMPYSWTLLMKNMARFCLIHNQCFSGCADSYNMSTNTGLLPSLNGYLGVVHQFEQHKKDEQEQTKGN